MEYSGKESSGEGVTGKLNLNDRFVKKSYCFMK
jgi:hypothetical protein